MDDLRAKGCRFSPLVKSGNQYQSSWICPATSGVVAMREVVTVDSTSKYLTASEIHHAERVVRATTEANRVGDCPREPAR
jgi:hypothetical protein